MTSLCSLFFFIAALGIILWYAWKPLQSYSSEVMSIKGASSNTVSKCDSEGAPHESLAMCEEKSMKSRPFVSVVTGSTHS